jgi:hypothetical protein
MIQIKNRYTENVIKEVNVVSLVNTDLRGADLWCADLRGADLRGADLLGADLWGADLLGADLGGANLLDTDLQCATLRYADLCGADLQRANLQYANLRGADLQRANLQGAILQDTNLKDTNLQNTNLRWVLGDGKRIKTIDDHYRIVIVPEYGVMAIGCEQHSIAKWMNFSDEEIDKMDTGALHWWKVWKPRIQQLIVG